EVAAALRRALAEERDLLRHVGGEDVGIAHVSQQAPQPLQLAAGLLDPTLLELPARLLERTAHAARRDSHPVHALDLASACQRVALHESVDLRLQIGAEMLDGGRSAPDFGSPWRRQVERLEHLRPPVAALGARRTQLALQARDQAARAVAELLDLDLVELAH